MYDLEKEKREAVKAGERALASLKSAKSKLDDANAYMEQAKRDLAGFGKELRDVEDFKDLGIKTDGFFSFADWFMDSTFADFVMQDRINNARDQVNKAIDRVESVLSRLKAK